MEGEEDEHEGDGIEERHDMSSMTLSIKQTMLIDDLQIQLTKMQIQCLEERRNYLGLVGQNEQLKLDNEEAKRKFQAALLMGKVDEKAVVHFLQKNPKAPQLTDEIIKVNEDIKNCNRRKVPQTLDNPVVLAKQVDFLQRHLKQMKDQNLVEIFGLKTSLELTLEERDVMREQYEGRIKEVVNKLEESRNLMHKMTEENLKLKKKMILFEQEKEKEHKKLLQRLTEAEEGGCRMLFPGYDGGNADGIKTSSGKRHKCVPPVHAHLLEKLTRTEIQLMEKSNVVKEYELKFIQMERKLQRSKEVESATKKSCSEIIRKLQTKNESIEARFNKLDERRKLDNAGFREDVKILRQLIKAIERKLHLFITRRLLSTENSQLSNPSFEAEIENPQPPKAVSPPERDVNVNVHPKNVLKVAAPNQYVEYTTKPRSKKKNVLIGQNPIDKHSPQQPPEVFDECKLKEFDIEEERRDSREELERDKLIFELLCKVLDSAKIKVNHIERGVLKQIF